MADKNQLHDQNNSQPKRRSSGRRKIKASDSSTSSSCQKKNKIPQRGMGVEKLENLRLQERWKLITENVPLPDPVLKLDGYGAPSVGAYLGFQYGQVDLFGFVNNNSGSHYCNACHKKKKFNGGECGILGLNNVGDYQNVIKQENDQGFNFGTKMAQGHVEIVAVHKKGSTPTSSSSKGVMMEYEFFPSSSTKSDSQININEDGDELMMMNLPKTPSSSMHRRGSSCVDLSLKLSY
ncbi:hypothetical protein CASFOL_041815 [Castilleja foliolosa]|uniref:Uncharacterized protein n=1 Tax=Castilleja foliolosa TaxID=1961234 RepID=A0ABD3B9I1_9LAMI